MSFRVMLNLSRRVNFKAYRAQVAIQRNLSSVLPLWSSLKKQNNVILQCCFLESFPFSSRFLHTTRCLNNFPTHIKVNLPALSPTMELGTIVSWQKKEGDKLSEGDLLCEIETDKATMGFETPEEGYLAKIIIQEGAKDIPIGKLLCIIVENKDDVAAFLNFSECDFASQPSTQLKPPSPQPAQFINAQTSPSYSVLSQIKAQNAVISSRIKASPYAKKVALQTGANLASIEGSGPSGRIRGRDVPKDGFSIGNAHDSIDDAHDSSSFKDIPLSNVRKTIAKRLSESKQTIPHYYLTSEIIIDDLLSVRSKLNKFLSKQAEKSGEKPVKLSVNDFVVKASALSCLRVPETNSFFKNTFIRQNNNVDVSVAVSTDAGLITPIVFNAHNKGVAAISSDVSSLAAKAREGKLQPQEYQGGTFTVSNLGMFGSVDHFTAIINPPQSCILAVGCAKKKLMPGDNDENVVVTVLNVTLSCDHRVVDGAVGATWLRHFKTFLEHPHAMLL